MRSMRKTLVILTPGFSRNEDDSTCLPPIQVVVKTLTATYPELNIVVLAFQYPFSAAKYKWHGANVMAFGGRSRGKGFRLFIWLKVWKKLLELKKKQQVIGLLSLWMGECALVGSDFGKSHHLTHRCWLQGQDAKAGNKYMRWVRPAGSELIAISDYLANELYKNYDLLPGHVIPIGIDTALFGHGPIERDIDVLGVGSLIPLKQYDLFIDTIRFLKEHIPGVKAVICGAGPEMERLKSMTASYGLEANISFKGELTHTEVLHYMQRSKVLLHPSNYEGFSTVLLEALYAGAHVVSFFRPMEEEFKHHHIVNDNNEMNHKVLSLLNDADREHLPVLIYDAEQTAKNIMQLFGL